jgi:hypothetical protein
VAAQSNLVGSIVASTMSFSVVDGSGFPVSGFQVSMDAEVMRISKRVGNVFTVDAMAGGGRGINGTVAASHNGAVTIEIPVVAVMAIRGEDGVLRPYDRRSGFPHTSTNPRI